VCPFIGPVLVAMVKLVGDGTTRERDSGVNGVSEAGEPPNFGGLIIEDGLLVSKSKKSLVRFCTYVYNCC
jgi:hypothetical protein